MDSGFLVFSIMRFVLTLVFLGSGILALIYGVRFYREGLGLAPDGTMIETDIGKKRVTVSLKTIGSVLMATSILWGLLAYLALPKAEVTISTGEKGEHSGWKMKVEMQRPPEIEGPQRTPSGK